MTTPEEATAPAERPVSESVPWPVVAITSAAGRISPFVPADRVAAEVAGFAQVVVSPTGDASWSFSRALPPLTQVYGGACRVFGPDGAWMTDPQDSPLRFVSDVAGGDKVADNLGRDAAAFAFAADKRGRADVARTPVSGTVLGVRANADWPSSTTAASRPCGPS